MYYFVLKRGMSGEGVTNKTYSEIMFKKGLGGLNIISFFSIWANVYLVFTEAANR